MSNLTQYQINKLTPGRHRVSENLYIEIKDSGASNWICRVQFKHQGRSIRRNFGVGSTKYVSLAEARLRTNKILLQSHGNYVEPTEKGLLKQERGPTPGTPKRSPSRTKTYSECIGPFMEVRYNGDKGDSKNNKQWEYTLRLLEPVLGEIPVHKIDVKDVVKALKPIWMSTNETGRRLRTRLEALLDWAKVMGFRNDGENPAVWKGQLSYLLPNIEKSKNNHPSLPYQHAPEFWKEIFAKNTSSYRCLQFCLLTGQRSGQLRNAKWEDIDLKKKVWTFPGENMKAGVKHSIPLSSFEIELLQSIPKTPSTVYVFATSTGGMLSDMALTQIIRKNNERRTKQGLKPWTDPNQGDKPIVVHGLRSTFRIWAAENRKNRQAAEFQLAHKLQDKIEAAYMRSNLLDIRSEIMSDWVCYVTGVKHVK